MSSVVHHHGRRNVRHVVKIDCAPARSGVRKPESTVTVQAGIELADHGHSQDQEMSTTEDYTTVLVEMEEQSV